MKTVEGVEKSAADILADNIQKIADSMIVLDGTRLKKSTVILLVSKDSGVGIHQVTNVLNSLESLADTYLKPKKKP